MKMLLIIVVILALNCSFSSKAIFAIDEGTFLGTADELVSPFGMCKLQLVPANCSLQYYIFNNTSQNYIKTNLIFKGNYTGSCSQLRIVPGKLITENSNAFMSLSSKDFVKTYFIVDDWGTARLIGIRSPSFQNQMSESKSFEGRIQKNTNLFILNDTSITADFRLNITNKRNWTFTIFNNLLTISNFRHIFQQELTDIIFSSSGLTDINRTEIPYANIPGLVFQKPCAGTILSLYGPFVISIDEYWPILTIHDAFKNKIMQFKINPHKRFCPPFTFEFKGDCVTYCPTPFSHMIKNSYGFCVLTCELGAIKRNDELNNRICTCQNYDNFNSLGINCVNISSYYFGCICQNNTYFNHDTFTCTTNCTVGYISLNGLCLYCGEHCLSCIVDPELITKLVCTSCASYYVLRDGICEPDKSNGCDPNCMECLLGTCFSCSPLFALSQNRCVSKCASNTKLFENSNFNYSCVSNLNSKTRLTCPFGCYECAESSNQTICLVCYNGYILFVSPFLISCRKNTMLLSCPSRYYQLTSSDLCYSNSTTGLSKLQTCISRIINCFLCSLDSSQCLICISSYFVQSNKCVQSCSKDYYLLKNRCVKRIENCLIHSFREISRRDNLTNDLIINSELYSHYLENGKEPINDPIGYQKYARTYHLQIEDQSVVTSIFSKQNSYCVKCNQGFGVSSNGLKCAPCSSECLLCQNTENAFCLARNSKELLERISNSGSNCYFTNQNYDCLDSCQEETIPVYDQGIQKIKCVIGDEDKQSNYIKVDGSIFKLSDNHYVSTFVFDKAVAASTNRLTQSSINSVEIGADGKSLFSFSSRGFGSFNLSQMVGKIAVKQNYYFSNSVYGLDEQTSYANFAKGWLAYIGYILSIFILLVHCIFIGNGLTYKMDNLIIFGQTVYFFIYFRLLVANRLVQYYYGWGWLHFNFFPNYFQSALPFDYHQYAPPPYVLLNIDSNFIRNAGSTLSLILTFFIAWIIISLIIYCMDTLGGRKQLWYFRVSKDSLISMVELLLYNILYWSVASLNYNKSSREGDSYVGLAVLLLVLIIIYLLLLLALALFTKYYFQKISIIYLSKRIILASILGCSYSNQGYAALMIMIELFFAIGRWVLQNPKTKKKKIILITEEILLCILYLIGYLSTNTSLIAISFTFFIYAWFLLFVSDLANIYLLSKNQIFRFPCLPLTNEETANKINEYEDAQTDRKIRS